MLPESIKIKLWKIFSLAPFVLLVMGCRNEVAEDLFFMGSNATSDYIPAPKRVEQNGVRISFKMGSDLRKGELVLMMNVRNQSDKSIVVDYPNCVLNLDVDDRVVIPKLPHPFKSTIPVDDEENYEIHFYPINSIEFYENTGYYGDMKPRYSLDLNFISDDTGKKLIGERVVFALQDSVYQNYIKQEARARSMQIFTFGFDNEIFDVREREHFNAIINNDAKGSPPAIYSINPAVTINRMIFNIYAFQEKDTLVVNMRMLNEDTHNLKIVPANCVANIADKKYLPVSFFSDTFEDGRIPNTEYIFKPGTRLHLHLKYFVPQKIDSWRLLNDWLLIDTESGADQWEPLLFDDIPFRGSVNTSDLLK